MVHERSPVNLLNAAGAEGILTDWMPDEAVSDNMDETVNS